MEVQFFGNQTNMKIYLIILNMILLSCNSTGSKNSETIINEYVDNKKVSTYYYNSSQVLEKEEIYNTDTNTIESELEYHYKNNSFDTLIVKKGIDLEYDHLVRDNKAAYEIVSANGIKFLYPEIVSNEIRDISNILSVVEESDIKETKTDGNKQTISFTGLNKNIRFYPSDISGFIPETTVLIDYQYTLDRDLITAEKYVTNSGVLVKTYSYNSEKISKILYEFDSKEHGKVSFEKRFDYN
ncbi:MAG: hypothetical protein QM564_06890 [Bergeyella sp.]